MTTWVSSDMQPKARLIGAFSTISLHYIVSTLAGIQTCHLGICRLVLCLGATKATLCQACDYLSVLHPWRAIVCFALLLRLTQESRSIRSSPSYAETKLHAKHVKTISVTNSVHNLVICPLSNDGKNFACSRKTVSFLVCARICAH